MRVLRVKNAKILRYYYYMNTSIKRNFQINISAPLRPRWWFILSLLPLASYIYCVNRLNVYACDILLVSQRLSFSYYWKSIEFYFKVIVNIRYSVSRNLYSKDANTIQCVDREISHIKISCRQYHSVLKVLKNNFKWKYNILTYVVT